MFETAKRVGIRPHDVAKMLDLNRVTVSMWFNGHSLPHRLLEKRVARLLDAVELAVQAGDLPGPPDLDRKERSLYAKRVLTDHLKASIEASTQHT